MEPSQVERWNPAIPLNFQAETLESLERFEEAVAVRQEVVERSRQLDDRRRLAVDLESLGKSLRKAKRLEEALQSFRESFTVGMEPSQVERWNPVAPLRRQAETLEDLERFDEAVVIRQAAVDLCRDLDDRRRLAVNLELLGNSLRKANRIDEAVEAFRRMTTITLEMSGGPQRSEWISHAVHATGVLGRALADVDRKIDALEEMDGGRALVEELSRSDVSDAKDLDIAASWWECHADCLESIGDDVYASRARRKAKALRARSAAIE